MLMQDCFQVGQCAPNNRIADSVDCITCPQVFFQLIMNITNNAMFSAQPSRHLDIGGFPDAPELLKQDRFPSLQLLKLPPGDTFLKLFLL